MNLSESWPQQQCSRPAVTRQTFALWIVPPTWFPANWSFLSAAEANFAKDAEDVSLTQRPRVFTGTWASLVSGDFVAVGLAGLALLSDQGAGDSRRHISERRTKPQRNKISAPAVRVLGWRPFSPKQVTCRLTGLRGTKSGWKIFSLMADRWLGTKTLDSAVRNSRCTTVTRTGLKTKTPEGSWKSTKVKNPEVVSRLCDSPHKTCVNTDVKKQIFLLNSLNSWFMSICLHVEASFLMTNPKNGDEVPLKHTLQLRVWK